MPIRGVRAETLRWSVGTFCAVMGALMLVAPHQLDRPAYVGLRVNLTVAGVAFLLAGCALIGVVVLAPRRRLEAGVHLFAGVLLLVLAPGVAREAGLSAAATIAALAAATILAPFLPPVRADRPEPTGVDLLALAIGLGAAIAGAVALAAPRQFDSAALQLLRSQLFWFGLVSLGSGAALVYAQVRPRPARALYLAPHFAAAALLFVQLVAVALPHRLWVGIALWAGFGTVVALVPWLSARLSRAGPTTLRTQLAVVLIGAVALPLVVTMALSAGHEERSATDEALDQQQAFAVALATDLGEYLKVHRAAVAALAAHPDLVALPPAEQRPMLELLGQVYPEVGVFSTYDAEGRPLARSDHLPGRGLATTWLFQTVRSTDAPALDVLPWAAGGRLELVFGAPVHQSNGAFAGVAVAEIDAERAGALLGRPSALGQSLVYVVDRAGRPIVHPDATFVDRRADLSQAPVVRALFALRRPSGQLRYSTETGDWLAGFARVPGVEWGLVVERPLTEALAAHRERRDLIFGYLLLVAGLSLSAGGLAATRLTAPLAALARAVDQMVVGDVGAPLPRGGSVEIAQLAAVVGRLRERLATRTAERERAVAALHETETQFRAIFDQAAIGVALLDLDGRVVRSNRALERMLGFNRGELQRVPLAQLCHPADVSADGLLFRDLVAGRRGHYRLELRYRRKDGGLLWGHLAVSLVRGAHHEPQYAVAMLEDLSERKQARDALRRAEAKYRSIVENALEGIYQTSVDGRFLTANPALARIFGYDSPDELIEQVADVGQLYVDRERHALLLAQIEEHGVVASFESQVYRKDGSVVWVSENARALRDGRGELIGYEGSLVDVTARKLAELVVRQADQRALEEYDRLLERLAGLARRLGTVDDLAGVFRALHDFALASAPCDALVVSLYDAERRERSCVYACRDGQELDVATLPALPLGDGPQARAVATGEVVVTDELDDADALADLRSGSEAGARVPRSSVVVPMATMGRIVGCFEVLSVEAGAFTDGQVAALRMAGNLAALASENVRLLERERQLRIAAQASEQRFRLLLDSVGEGIVGLDRAGRIVFANPAAVRLTGFSLEELLGQRAHDLLHHSRPDGTPLPFEECPGSATLRDGVLVQVTDAVLWRKDGSSFPAEYVITPLRERDEIIGAVTAFKDITERRAVERMKDEFIAVVSHELRTPLTAIRGALGLLAGGVFGPLPPEGQRMVDVAVANTDRLVRLTNEILEFDRLESGSVSLSLQACDAGELMLQAVEALRAVAERSNVSLGVAPLTARVLADPDRIVQVLINLLDNAIKFSPPGAVVRVEGEREPERAVIRVKDHGRGIPPEKLGLIFERFRQVDASDAREKGGSGLGLAICRSIVEQHGGQIWAESAPGQGSTFYFTLPLAPEAPGGERATIPDGPTVLVCDDDSSTLDVVGAMLRRRGFRVLATPIGAEALRVAAAEQPAAVLIDLAMARSSGWEVLAALKTQPQTASLPVVLFGGLAPDRAMTEQDDATEAEERVDHATVLQAVTRALGGGERPARVLVVEDDRELAGALAASFKRHGARTSQARSSRAAIRQGERSSPDLLVLDLGLPEGDGFAVVDWLRDSDRLAQVPVLVYAADGLDESERERLRAGETRPLARSRVALEEFERRIGDLLNRVVPAGRGADGRHAQTGPRR